MGVLGVNGSGDGSQHIDAPEAEAPEAPVADGQPRGPDGTFVAADKLQPESAASRRERQWQERVANYVKPIEEKWTTERQTYQTQLEQERQARQQQAEALARLQGQIEAMQRQPPPQMQSQQAQGPDPAELRRQARAALQEKNSFEDYERLMSEATRIEVERTAETKVRAAIQQFQQNQPPQIPHHIQQLLYTAPNVAAAGFAPGSKGLREVLRAEEDLADEGMPAGYARQQEAFKRANAKLAPKTTPTPPAYSQDQRATLAGIPAGRPAPASASSGAGVKLTAAQEAAMKAGGFESAESYLKWGDPYKYGLVKQ